MKVIRAGNFYEFVKCPRKVYLKFYGDHKKKIPFSEFMQQKMKEGREYEAKIAKRLKFAKPEEDVSYEEAFKQTVDFMKKAEPMIYQGMLIHDNLIGIPDLLEKKKGKSKLGNYYYQPIDIKLGRSAKDEYTMQVSFYCYLLEKIQGFFPPKFKLLYGDGRTEELESSAYFDKFSSMFSRIKEIAKGKKEPVHIFGQCKECQWKDFCFSIAKKTKDLSLIYNLSRLNASILKEKGIKDLDDASKMDIDKLSEIKGLGQASLEKWKQQAQSLLTKKPINIEKYYFPKTKLEIYFDVEDAEVDKEKIVYLFGMVIDGKYTYFLADNPKKEKQAWKEFLDFFKDKDDFKLYVYSGHEKSMLNKLYEKHGGDEAVFKKIISNLIDLLAVVRRTTIFPVYSYSIKDIAKFLGFKWSSDQAGGGQSMIWYDKWLMTKKESYLKEVLRYNKEDCEAEVVIRDFIEKNKY
ncbi:TM0106 family RecB-like putative nuclease [Candidatus Woesearchaeota archaeon]|nr:TM0106 family RecB-like putative nuclease [Candidatus Woesearchaeota archaeon]